MTFVALVYISKTMEATPNKGVLMSTPFFLLFASVLLKKVCVGGGGGYLLPSNETHNAIAANSIPGFLKWDCVIRKDPF